jgi:hypothetical protein
VAIQAHPRETPDLEVLFSQSDGPRIRERITRDLAQVEITPLKGCEHKGGATLCTTEVREREPDNDY